MYVIQLKKSSQLFTRVLLNEPKQFMLKFETEKYKEFRFKLFLIYL